MTTQEQRITSVANEVCDTLIRKNRDYGDSFAKRFEKHGILSAFIRMEDKWGRLENLLSGAEAQVKDESIEDTIRDLVGYGVLTLVELQKQKEPKVEDKRQDDRQVLADLRYQLGNYSQLKEMYPKSELIQREYVRIRQEIAKLDDF